MHEVMYESYVMKTMSLYSGLIHREHLSWLRYCVQLHCSGDMFPGAIFQFFFFACISTYWW